jgi:hypothetical protein
MMLQPVNRGIMAQTPEAGSRNFVARLLVPGPSCPARVPARVQSLEGEQHAWAPSKPLKKFTIGSSEFIFSEPFEIGFYGYLGLSVGGGLLMAILGAVTEASFLTSLIVGLLGFIAISLAIILMIFYRRRQSLPLEIIFDPTNPNKKFWSIEPIRDKDGRPTDSYWEYRSIIKNTSSRTVRNVKATVEAVGAMPTRPVSSLFDINKKPVIDLAPHEEALAVIHTWFNPKIVQGMAIGPGIYGPIKMTVSADDVLPTTKIFQFDPMQTPMIYEL